MFSPSLEYAISIWIISLHVIWVQKFVFIGAGRIQAEVYRLQGHYHTKVQSKWTDVLINMLELNTEESFARFFLMP